METKMNYSITEYIRIFLGGVIGATFAWAFIVMVAVL